MVTLSLTSPHVNVLDPSYLKKKKKRLSIIIIIIIYPRKSLTMPIFPKNSFNTIIIMAGTEFVKHAA